MQSLPKVEQITVSRHARVRRVSAVSSEMTSHAIVDKLYEYQEIHDLLCTWLSPYKAANEDASTGRTRERFDEEFSGEDGLILMSKRLVDLSRATKRLQDIQNEISRFQLGIGRLRLSITQNTTVFISATESILLRVFDNKSFCRYDPALGILSSNSKVCKPVRNIDELKARAELTEATLRNHCGGDNSTSFISLTNEVKYLSRYTEGKWKHRDPDVRSSAMVALVNKAKLDYMEVFCATSRSLVEAVGAKYWSRNNPDGVSYASHEHFMVYGWIPPQCIERVIPLDHFKHTYDTSIIEPEHVLAYLDSEGDDSVEDLNRNLGQTL
ncbi:hypothetical protein D6C76_07988 [Aureobasidium pullulans]|nr:hypothetical protein D6C76_07988 [Aureobasidium pullulans]